MFEKEMRNLTYGLFVLSAAADGKSSGCIIIPILSAASKAASGGQWE